LGFNVDPKANTHRLMDDLRELASLLKERNEVEGRISRLIQRPALTGHLGEFIAARIFEIDLAASATSRAIDGTFRKGPLATRSVNIKCYPKLESLDMREDALPEFYLVLTGPRSPATTSRGSARPFVIDHVFLFEAKTLCAELRARPVKIQTGTSLLRAQWDAAEIYPRNRCRRYTISNEQKSMLALFASLVG
jgi:hypothetical protein